MTEEKKTERNPEELRAKLLDDPATKEIADYLRVPLETYIEKVIDYALHPEKEPMLSVLPEEQVKALGGLTAEDLTKKIDEVMKKFSVSTNDSFDEVSPKRNIVDASNFSKKPATRIPSKKIYE